MESETLGTRVRSLGARTGPDRGTDVLGVISSPERAATSWAELCRLAAGVREAIEAVGAVLRYLPPYSPDLNPIELAFAKLKKLLRDGAKRTVDKLCELCGRILDEFSPIECQNYFRHCGYRYV